MLAAAGRQWRIEKLASALRTTYRTRPTRPHTGKVHLVDCDYDAEGVTESPEEDEIEPDMRMTLHIFWDVLCNSNLQTWFIYNFFAKAACSIASNMSQVYLTNDL